MIRDLHEFLLWLEKRKRLLRVKSPVSPELEITAFTDLANRHSRYASKSLLFDAVKGYDIPVATNLFGHAETLRELFKGRAFDSLLAGAISGKFDIKLLGAAKMLLDSKPKVTSRRHDYVRLSSLDELPIPKVWPGDAGRYITFPLVVSRSPQGSQINVGVYRLQVYDSNTTGMHWQSQKGGAIHADEALEKGAMLNVSAAIGSDPYNMLSGIMPLPPNLNEFAFSGILRGGKSLLMENGKYPPVPANSEFILNGYVDPNEKRVEGPFGDHTGYYSLPESYHVFHIDEIYMRPGAVYASSVVGKPWHEDAVIGMFILDYLKPFIKSLNSSIRDIYLPPEGLFNSLCLVSIKKRFPGEAKKAMFSVLGLGQLSFTKIVMVFDDDIDLKDTGQVLWALSTRVEPEHDIEVVRHATSDSLDHMSAITSYGSKLLIDATKKRRDEGFPREWPDTITMPKAVTDKVNKLWGRMKH